MVVNNIIIKNNKTISFKVVYLVYSFILLSYFIFSVSYKNYFIIQLLLLIIGFILFFNIVEKISLDFNELIIYSILLAISATILVSMILWIIMKEIDFELISFLLLLINSLTIFPKTCVYLLFILKNLLLKLGRTK